MEDGHGFMKAVKNIQSTHGLSPEHTHQVGMLAYDHALRGMPHHCPACSSGSPELESGEKGSEFKCTDCGYSTGSHPSLKDARKKWLVDLSKSSANKIVTERKRLALKSENEEVNLIKTSQANESTAVNEEELVKRAKEDKRPDSDFDAEQLKVGIKVEMEHTKDPEVAKVIAKDHLSETKDYYKKLDKAGLIDEQAIADGLMAIYESMAFPDAVGGDYSTPNKDSDLQHLEDYLQPDFGWPQAAAKFVVNNLGIAAIDPKFPDEVKTLESKFTDFLLDKLGKCAYCKMGSPKVNPSPGILPNYQLICTNCGFQSRRTNKFPLLMVEWKNAYRG